MFSNNLGYKLAADNVWLVTAQTQDLEEDNQTS